MSIIYRRIVSPPIFIMEHESENVRSPVIGRMSEDENHNTEHYLSRVSQVLSDKDMFLTSLDGVHIRSRKLWRILESSIVTNLQLDECSESNDLDAYWIVVMSLNLID